MNAPDLAETQEPYARRDAPRYHPTVADIVVGDTVARRTDRLGGPLDVEPLGQVDSLGDEAGQRWAIVSWPAKATATAPTDDRGRRAQAFDLAALMVVPSQHAETGTVEATPTWALFVTTVVLMAWAAT